MNQQQTLFGLVCGALLTATGAYLATRGLADWSLCGVGLALSVIALASRSAAGARQARQLSPVELRLDTNSGAE